MKTKISWGVGLLAAVSIAVALEIVLLAPYPITFENYADDAAFDADPFFEQTSVGNDPSSIDLATGCGVQGTKCIQFSAQGNAGPRLEHKEQGLTLEAGKTYFVAYGAKGTGSAMVI